MPKRKYRGEKTETVFTSKSGKLRAVYYLSGEMTNTRKPKPIASVEGVQFFGAYTGEDKTPTLSASGKLVAVKRELAAAIEKDFVNTRVLVA